ncbi:MAG: homoserine dehydrogenase [Clostridiales bacterium]|nr:homoserine dehydrogenase [Clostridiales bacterium]
MKKVGVAILGLGVVGGGTYKILTEHRELYKKAHGLDIEVESVLEIRKERALALGIEEGKIASNIAEICSNPEVDIVIEVMGGVEPAKTFVLAALNAGKSVVTSNKELFCKYNHELEKVAKKNNCGLFFEASCVGGVPVIRALLDNLQGNKITSMMGIINGTTNYILTKMSEANGSVSYEEVLKEAQALGYAELDPTADVEGYDASYKLSILSSLAFHTKIPFSKVHREGITSVSAEDIIYGKQLGFVLKLLAIGKNTDRGIEVRVHPTYVKSSHPLASVNDSYNAVYITGDAVEDVMLYGRGAGALPTGSAIVGDVIYCAKHNNYQYSTFNNTEDADPSTKFIDNFRSAYYLRLNVVDKAGVLAKLSAVFARYGISVAKMVQEAEKENGDVPLIFITHETKENSIKKAIADINASGDIAKLESVIRVVG